MIRLHEIIVQEPVTALSFTGYIDDDRQLNRVGSDFNEVFGAGNWELDAEGSGGYHVLIDIESWPKENVLRALQSATINHLNLYIHFENGTDRDGDMFHIIDERKELEDYLNRHDYRTSLQEIVLSNKYIADLMISEFGLRTYDKAVIIKPDNPHYIGFMLDRGSYWNDNVLKYLAHNEIPGLHVFNRHDGGHGGIYFDDNFDMKDLDKPIDSKHYSQHTIREMIWDMIFPEA